MKIILASKNQDKIKENDSNNNQNNQEIDNEQTTTVSMYRAFTLWCKIEVSKGEREEIVNFLEI